MKIISGGQTGADRAGLDVAIALGMEYGGTLPKGRITEDGPLSAKYKNMVELPAESYPARTAVNVRQADATLVFTAGMPDRGSALTIQLAQRYKRPFLHIDLINTEENDAITSVKEWLGSVKPSILNIAGSRESTSRGTYKKVYAILQRVLRADDK